MSYVTEFNEYAQKMEALKTELCSQLSAVDKEQEDILHFFEFDTYDAVTMVMVTKKLKEVRQKRRGIKRQLESITPICSRLGKPNMTDIAQVTWKYKTDVLDGYNHQEKITIKRV